MLEVTFENGDHFLVAVESIVPPAGSAARVTRPAWAKLRIGETGDVLEGAGTDGIIEIPWARIRSLADPELRVHLSDRAGECAGRLGARIRAMRVEAGLTRETLAGRVGVRREQLADLEAGKTEPQTDLIEPIARALARRLRDLAEE